MRKKSKVIKGLLIMIMLCSPCFSALAEEVGDCPDIKIKMALSKLDRLPLGADTTNQEIIDSIQLVSYCSIVPTSTNADWNYIECGINWDTSTLKTDTVGYQVIKGTAIPKEPRFSPFEVSHRVLIYEPGGEPQDEIFMEDSSWEREVLTMPIGWEAEEYEQGFLTGKLFYINSENEFVIVDPTYNWSEVDLETPGQKTVKYTVEIPEGLWSQKTEGEAQIYIIDPEVFSLGNYIYEDGVLLFTWEKSFPDFESKMKLRIAQDKGDWTVYSYEEGQTDGFFTLEPGYLKIDAAKLKTNVKYSIQLTYEEEISDIAEAKFYYDDDGSLQMMLQFIEGKRDGDQGGDNLPPLQQPGIPGDDDTQEPALGTDQKENTDNNQTKTVPYASYSGSRSATAGNQSAQKPVIETITEDETIINGIRLNKLMELHKDMIVFEKHDISIYVPTEFLKGLQVGDDELFQVTIKKWGDGFSVDMTVNGVRIDNVPEYKILIPASTQKAEINYVGESGGNYVAVRDQNTNVYSTVLKELGRFYQEQEVVEGVERRGAAVASDFTDSSEAFGSEKEKASGWVAGVVAAAGIVGAAIYVCRKRRKRNE